ncbi:serine hydrolase domain-containing protein [Saccharicrinis sp. FJH62]|uniref:serine hydrolase domain-containing protein n=1 Tax=Saccharicrinis sp. FJH62 TaxID=3344657 RepID=UPI0035D3E06F
MQNHHKIVMIIIAVTVIMSSCCIIYNVPDTSDYKIFPYRVIKNTPESVFNFHKPERLNDLGSTVFTNYNLLLPNVVTLDTYLEDSKTAAFLIIRNDTLLYEKYNNAYQESSIFNTFSVTKIFVTTLTGIAINEGMIKNVDQAITEYLPELAVKEGFSKITIKHLLLHTSGIKFSDAEFSPFSDNAKYYYTHHLRKLVFKAEISEKPGEKTHYSSVNVQLLTLILERATGVSVSEYLQEKIWQPIGMQYEARWSVDNKRKNPIEKGFSNLNCTAIDMAKLGRLYINKGLWNNNRLLSEEFINNATKRDTTDGSCSDFQYNIRFDPLQPDYYYARGLYGQLILIYPKKKIIIVRTGETDLKYNPQFMNRIVLQIIDQI